MRELEHVISRAAVLANASSTDADIVLTAQHLTLPKHDGSIFTPEETAIHMISNNKNFAVTLSAGQNLKQATELFQKQLIKQCYEKIIKTGLQPHVN